MSNSTTPADENSKQNSKQNSKKDRKMDTSNTELNNPETNSNHVSDQAKSISSSTGKSTSLNESLSASMNDKNQPKNSEITENAATTNNSETATPEQKKNADKRTESTTTEATAKKSVTPEPVAEKPAVNTNNTHPHNNTPPTKSSGSGNRLSIIAIALVIALGGGIYYHGHTQGKLQQETIQALKAKIDQLEPQVAGIEKNYTQLSNAQNNDQKSEQILAQQKQLQQQYQQQQQLIATVEKESAQQLEQFKALQNKVSSLSNTEANLWLLAEADFLVKQAVRKLNTEKDITTAIALLTSADASIRDMNDPSLHELRRAIASDISTLSSIKRIDIDGTVIKLYQLSDQLDKMALIRNQLDDHIAEPESLEVSGDISDWQDNLSKTWKGFMADFITITPIDNKVSDTNKPELTANQGAYLRENIRLQLLIAAQAVPGYQAETYNQALAKAMAWVKEYYVADNQANQAFIETLAQLQQQNIRVDIPTQLSSQPLLNKQVEVRLRNLTAQNAKPAGVGE